MAEADIREINRRATEEPEALVTDAERSYGDRIRRMAEAVRKNGGVRVVLLAGPSASGKTTTANLLADRIRADGHRCEVISLDDFYRDAYSAEYPKLQDGSPDFENVLSLDLPLIEKTLTDVIEGRSFCVPRYDFHVSARKPGEFTEYGPIGDGCVIVEGLHALNPLISGGLDADHVLRIFVSVSTNVNGDGVRLLSGRKMRFIRRMVRDARYRGRTPDATYASWGPVVAGEDKYLYPFRDLADIAFDTFHPFELCVMRDEALELLRGAKKDDYLSLIEAGLSRAVPLPESLIPDSSLIREFIIGGTYEHLY